MISVQNAADNNENTNKNDVSIQHQINNNNNKYQNNNNINLIELPKKISKVISKNDLNTELLNPK